MERSLGGELEEICGGLSAAAGFRITSNASPPAFVLGLSAMANEHRIYPLSNYEGCHHAKLHSLTVQINYMVSSFMVMINKLVTKMTSIMCPK